MFMGLSIAAILFSPVTSVLFLLGVGLYALFRLNRSQVTANIWTDSLFLLTVWSILVAMEQNSIASLAASLALLLFWLLSQVILAMQWDEERLYSLLSKTFHIGTGTALIGWLEQWGFLPSEGNLLTWALGWVPFVPIDEPRISGTFSNPNFAAAWYAVLILIGIFIWEQKTEKLWQYVIGFELSFTAGALYFTGSRGGILAVIAGLFVYLLIRFRTKAPYYLTTAFSLGLGVFVWNPALFPRSDIFWKSLDTRLQIWRTGWNLFLHKPITGYGLANMWFLDPWVTHYPMRLPHAHNIFLSMAVDLGIVGLFLFLVMIYQVIHDLISLSAAGHPYAAILGAIVASLLTQGMVDHILFLPQVAIIFIVTSSLILKLSEVYVPNGRMLPLLLH
ncbi:MAG: O-antigen ligase family protein [Thermicanus sp.]|nr:O-antigen ligase family protein [Thermicanus sp.]